MTIDEPTNNNNAFTAKFWGVRGQVPTPGKETYRFGGNTPCLEVNVEDQHLIFDGGTGLRVLGNAMLARMPVESHLFFTHANWDRIQGFPFFVPAFVPGNHFHLYGTANHEGKTLEYKLSKQMHGPNFPVPIQVMGAKLMFHPLEAGEEVSFGQVKIISSLVHAQHQALGFRVQYKTSSLVYATDSDIQDPNNRQALEQLAADADLLILNTPTSRTACDDLNLWLPLLDFARNIGVKNLLFSTHNPNCNDPYLTALETTLQKHYEHLQLAKEGTEIRI